MTVKTFEVRDVGTTVPVLALKLGARDARDRWILDRTGYETPEAYVILLRLNPIEGQYDPYEWTYGRTLRIAHFHLQEHFDDLPNGAVIDVQFILGETPSPRETEQVTR